MAHNNFRKIHHAGPLTLDAALSNQAQLYAEYLAQQAGGLVHSSQALRPGEARASPMHSAQIRIHARLGRL